MLGSQRVQWPVRSWFGRGVLAALPAVLAAHAVWAQTPIREVDDATLLAQVEAAMHGTEVAGGLPVKCMMPLLIEMEARGYDLAALPMEAAADDMLEYFTPDGNFRLEYYLTGDHAVNPTDADLSGVPDYVEWVGEAMQESWAREIDQLGFPPIPLAEGERYRVQLRAIGGTYGWTNFAGVTDPGGSNIVINADFEGFYASFPSLLNEDPDGLVRGGIRVTCAHEFKHALQIAAGWVLGATPQWFEVDATAMEDLVYDQVNDYYNYIRGTGSPFTSPQTSLNSGSQGYEDATWHLFLFEEYGVDFLREFSAYRGVEPLVIAPNAYRTVATNRSIVWQDLWREYALWNFLTAQRATASRGFEEGGAYPVAPTQAIGAVPYGPAGFSLAPWANRFHVFDNSERLQRGGVRVVFTNVHLEWGVSLVLQRADATVVVPMTVGTSPNTLEARGVDVAHFDRVAVVVGNGRASQNTFESDAYSLTVEFDEALLNNAPNNIGTLKRAFGRSQRD